MTYLTLGRPTEGIDVLELALPISQEVGDKENILDATIYLARANREIGQISKAIELYRKAETLSGPAGSPHTLDQSFGVTYAQVGDYVRARQYFDKALLSCRKLGDLGAEATLLYHYARLERAENRLDAARKKIEDALQIHEFEQAKSNNMRRLSKLLESRRRYFDLYIDVLMLLDKERPSEGFAFKALQTSESARMRTLIWQYREAIQKKPLTLDFQLLSQGQKIQRRIGEQLSFLSKAQSSPTESSKISETEQSLAALHQENEKLEAQFRASNPNIANLSNPPLLDLATMQTELGPETALVEYSLGEDRSYMWIVDSNGVRSVTLPKRSDIESQALTFYSSLSSTDGFSQKRSQYIGRPTTQKSVSYAGECSSASTKLAQILSLKDIVKTPSKRLAIVSDGSLSLIPFSGLCSDDNNRTTLLADKFEIVNLPSLTTIHVLRDHNLKTFTPRSVAVLADPVFSQIDERLFSRSRKAKKTAGKDLELASILRDFSLTSLSRLPFTRFEAKEIQNIHPSGTSLNLDFGSNRDKLLNGNFNHYDILHLATHGFVNNKHPELSALVLSLFDEKGNPTNGFVRTRDIYFLNLKAQLVVLSACQTGLGKQTGYEGVNGLTRAFLAIGTPRVVSTLWKVDDKATAEFMGHFYRAIFIEKQEPSAALRNAQSKLRSTPRFQNPKYWAGFTLTGYWR